MPAQSAHAAVDLNMMNTFSQTCCCLNDMDALMGMLWQECMHGCSGKAIMPVLLDDCHVDSLLRMAALALCSSGDIWLLWHIQKVCHEGSSSS